MPNPMTKLRINAFAYYNQRKGWDKEAAEIADTMCMLKAHFPGFSEEFIFLLSHRRFGIRKRSSQPILAQEMDDALRFVLEVGVTCCCGYDIDAKDMPRFLQCCPPEVFRYILESEAAENRGRFELEYPEVDEKELARMIEDTLALYCRQSNAHASTVEEGEKKEIDGQMSRENEIQAQADTVVKGENEI